MQLRTVKILRHFYKEHNQRLAELHTQFGNNSLADEEGYVL